MKKTRHAVLDKASVCVKSVAVQGAKARSLLVMHEPKVPSRLCQD